MHTMGSKWELVGCHFESPSRAHITSTSKRVWSKSRHFPLSAIQPILSLGLKVTDNTVGL